MLEEHDLASGKKKNGWLYWPMTRSRMPRVRESLVLGYKALEIAALHAFNDDAVPDSSEDEPSRRQIG